MTSARSRSAAARSSYLAATSARPYHQLPQSGVWPLRSCEHLSGSFVGAVSLETTTGNGGESAPRHSPAALNILYADACQFAPWLDTSLSWDSFDCGKTLIFSGRDPVSSKGKLFVGRVKLALISALAACLASASAQAELGGLVASVAIDRSRMNARMASIAMGAYTRHDLTRTNDGIVREFTNASGEVFAVTWFGPGKPDLRALLGRYFTALQASPGATGRAMHSLRRPQQVDQSDLQIQTGGHMGWFHGVAFVPSLAPAGFVPGDLAREP